MHTLCRNSAIAWILVLAIVAPGLADDDKLSAKETAALKKLETFGGSGKKYDTGWRLNYGKETTDEALGLAHEFDKVEQLTLADNDNFETCKITPNGFRHIGKLANLEDLTLRYNFLTDEILLELKPLKQLKRFSIYRGRTSPRGFDVLTGMNRLEELHVADVTRSFEGPDFDSSWFRHLRNCTSLKSFEVYSVPILNDTVVHLSGLPLLVELRVAAAPIRGSELVHLAKLSKLERIDLLLNEADDADFRHMAKLPLEVLKLNYAPLGDVGFAHIAGIGTLKTLHLAGTRVSDVGLSTLKSRSTIETIDVSDTSVKGSFLTGDWAALEYLTLSGSPFSTDNLSAVAKLPKLSSLTVDDNAFDDEALANIPERKPPLKKTVIELNRYEFQKKTFEAMNARGWIVPLEVRSIEDDPEYAKKSRSGYCVKENLMLTRFPSDLDCKKTEIDLGYSSSDKSRSISAAALSTLAKIPKLKELDIRSRIAVWNLPAITKSASIEELDFRHSRAFFDDRELAILAEMKSLKRLSLPSNRTITGAGIRSLGELPILTNLSIDGGTVTNDVLQKLALLKSLKSLSLNYTNITDKQLGILHTLKTLESLDLKSCRVSDDAVDLLNEAIPKLRIYRKPD